MKILAVNMENICVHVKGKLLLASGATSVLFVKTL